MQNLYSIKHHIIFVLLVAFSTLAPVFGMAQTTEERLIEQVLHSASLKKSSNENDQIIANLATYSTQSTLNLLKINWARYGCSQGREQINQLKQKYAQDKERKALLNYLETEFLNTCEKEIKEIGADAYLKKLAEGSNQAQNSNTPEPTTPHAKTRKFNNKGSNSGSVFVIAKALCAGAAFVLIGVCIEYYTSHKKSKNKTADDEL